MNDQQIREEFDKVWKKIAEIERVKKEIPEKSHITNDEGVFYVEGEELTLTRFKGDKAEDKTQNIALLTLFGYKDKLKKDKILASEIKRNVAINKVPIENFGTYMKELIPQSILRIGKPGSKKTTYKLTFFGESRAKHLLQELNKE